MKWIVSWIASLCIMSGGLYAMNYFNQQLAMKQERYEQSYGIFKTFQGAFYSIDEVIYSLPLTAATLLVVIGIIMMWDRSFLFVYMSLFLACFIFNWVGALLSIIGTMTFYTVWRNRTEAHQTKSGKPIFAIVGWVFASISLVFMPALFGVFGIVCGLLHRRINIAHGNFLVVMSVVFPIPGSIISIFIGELMG